MYVVYLLLQEAVLRIHRRHNIIIISADLLQRPRLSYQLIFLSQFSRAVRSEFSINPPRSTFILVI